MGRLLTLTDLVHMMRLTFREEAAGAGARARAPRCPTESYPSPRGFPRPAHVGDDDLLLAAETGPRLDTLG